MSQISEIIEKNKPAYIFARLEATTFILEELVKLLSSEQRAKLNEAIIASYPTIQNDLTSNAYTIDYQLSISIKKCIEGRD